MPETVPTTRPAADPEPAPPAEEDRIVRFHRSERLIHWAVGIPFMLCYITAVILIAVYNPDPTRPFRSIVAWTHRLSGVCLFVLPAVVIARHVHDLNTHLHNVRQAWTWTLGDLKWLLLVGPASLMRDIALPDQGKFNAGEKINFMVLTATYPVYLATGLTIWFGGAAFGAWLAHISLAIVATPLLLGHIFMATVNPDTRPGLAGMLSGLVDRDWARHHYQRWYQEHYGVLPAAAQPPDDTPAEPAPDAGAATLPACARADACLAASPRRLFATLGSCPRCPSRMRESEV